MALDLPVADGVRVPPRQAARLEAAVRAVAARVPPGGRSTSTTRRADLVTVRPPAALRARRPARTRPATTSPRPAWSPRRRCSARSSRDLERTRHAGRRALDRPASPPRASRTPPGARAACACSTTTWRGATRPAARFGALRAARRAGREAPTRPARSARPARSPGARRAPASTASATMRAQRGLEALGPEALGGGDAGRRVDRQRVEARAPPRPAPPGRCARRTRRSRPALDALEHAALAERDHRPPGGQRLDRGDPELLRRRSPPARARARSSSATSLVGDAGR